MSGHTPGKWEWSTGDIGGDYPVPYSDIHVDDIVIAENVRREDGQLIAAAPDLLEALKELASVNVHPIHAEKLAKARAAIAKAEASHD